MTVFEDDVVLCQGFAERMRSAEEKLPNDWMVLYFGCVFRTPPEEVTPGLLRVTGPTWDMHGYMIRWPLWELVSQELAGASCRSRVEDPEGDSQLAEKSEAWWKLTPKERGRRRWATACDVILADYHKHFPAYAVWPPMAWQVNGLSNNENAVRGNYRPDGTQDLYRHTIRGLPGVADDDLEPLWKSKSTAGLCGCGTGGHRAGKCGASSEEPRGKQGSTGLRPVRMSGGTGKTNAPAPVRTNGGTGRTPVLPVRQQALPARPPSGGKGRGILLSPYSVRTERMAWRMAESLRWHSPEIPVQIYAQDYVPTLPWKGLASVKVTRGWHTGRDDLRWVNKLEAVGNSRFEETLFFDCDMLATEPVAGWFEDLGHEDLSFWMMRRTLADSADQLEFNLLNPHRFCPHYGVPHVPTMIGGGHYFVRKSGKSENLLRRIAEIMLEATEDPTCLYWKLAGTGNIIGDEPAASMVAIEENLQLPEPEAGSRLPVGCFMPPWQKWVDVDPAHSVMRYACGWSGKTEAPAVIHFAGNGKDDSVYRNWIESAAGLVPAASTAVLRL